MPPGPAVLAGRALALQLLGARIAVASGLAPASVALGAIPDWLLDGPESASRGLAEVVVRRRLHPGHPLSFTSPLRRDGRGERLVAATWERLVAATLPAAGDAAYVVRRAPVEGFESAAIDHAATTTVAAAVAGGLASPSLRGEAAGHAAAMIAAAAATLEGLADAGWRAVLGQPITPSQPGRLGADAVAERTESFDPLT
jgi:hypothetical protein